MSDGPLRGEPAQRGWGTVGWLYQESVDPLQRTPGVGPVEGTAEAVGRGGRITVLTFVEPPASAHRQRGEVAAALDGGMTT
jgi:hypothetical protein